MFNISRGLLDAGHDLTILAIETHKHSFLPEQVDKNFLKQTRYDTIFVDTRINVVDAFSSVITDDSYNISRFFSPDFDAALVKILKKEKFDIVHLESLFMTPYIGSIRRHSKAKIVLRSHNLEHIIWERLAGSTRNILKRQYLQLLSRQIRKHEKNTLSQVDGLAAITPEDAAKYIDMGYKGPLITIPFGIYINDYQMRTEPVIYPGLFHLGSMDWKPNEEGIQWMLETVWPLIIERIPDIKLYLAGRNMPDWIHETGMHNVVVDGEVENAKKYLCEHQIMIVPLLSAGGMRVKIIEGLALGKVIISTTTGAEGIQYEDGKHLLIANSPEEIAATVQRLTEHPELITEIGCYARKLVEDQYSYLRIGNRLVEFYQTLMK